MVDCAVQSYDIQEYSGGQHVGKNPPPGEQERQRGKGLALSPTPNIDRADR